MGRIAMRTASGSASPIDGNNWRARRTRSRASGINGLSTLVVASGVDLHQLGMGPFDRIFGGHALHRLGVHVDDDEFADRFGGRAASRPGIATETTTFRRGAEWRHHRIV